MFNMVVSKQSSTKQGTLSLKQISFPPKSTKAAFIVLQMF